VTSVVATSLCPIAVQECMGAPCTVLRWEVTEDWGPCSAPCISVLVPGDNSTSNMGVSVRTPAVCIQRDGATGEESIVRDSQCEALLPVRSLSMASTWALWTVMD
jgi:hypothetical protein